MRPEPAQRDRTLQRRTVLRVLVPAFGYLAVLLAVALLLDSHFIETGPRSNVRRILQDQGPVEWGQWLFYGLAGLTAAAMYGRLHQSEQRRQQTFWGLLALFFIWCLMEDAGNQRWTLGGYVRIIFGGQSHDWTAIAYLVALGGFGAALFWFYRDVAFASRPSRPFLYIGIGTFIFSAGGLEVGTRAVSILFVPEAFLMHTPLIGELVLDDIEEIFEFTGAAFLFAGLYTYWQQVEQDGLL